jgi:hypothetical protein
MMNLDDDPKMKGRGPIVSWPVLLLALALWAAILGLGVIAWMS